MGLHLMTKGHRSALIRSCQGDFLSMPCNISLAVITVLGPNRMNLFSNLRRFWRITRTVMLSGDCRLGLSVLRQNSAPNRNERLGSYLFSCKSVCRMSFTLRSSQGKGICNERQRAKRWDERRITKNVNENNQGFFGEKSYNKSGTHFLNKK